MLHVDEIRPALGRFLVLVAMLCIPLSFTACDDDDDVYISDFPRSGSYMLFYNLCPSEAEVRIWVNGDFVCSSVFGDDVGCLIQVPPGLNSYYAEGATRVWGNPSVPIGIEVDDFDVEIINLRCN